MAKPDPVHLFQNRVRDPSRPGAQDLLARLFPDFEPFEGQGESLLAGKARFLEKDLYVIAQKRDRGGRKDPAQGGMLTAGEHGRILDFLDRVKASDTQQTFLLSIVDTPGADPSVESAQGFQVFFIARLIKEFLTLPVRTISLVLGEACGPGAAALQVADVSGQLEDALFPAAPPEIMASVVLGDPARIRDALTILKPTARELKQLGAVHRIVPSPEMVGDADRLAENTREFLTRVVKDLSRSRIKRLVRKRRARAKKYGATRGSGRLHDIRRYVEKPIKKALRKSPPQLEIQRFSSALELPDDYGVMKGEKGSEFFLCEAQGCGKRISVQDFVEHFHVCPECGHTYVMGASGWIDCLADSGTFHELYRDLSVDQLVEEKWITRNYRDFLARQQGRSPFKESLVVGSAGIHHYPVVMAVGEFYFCGGSMGVVFGEKLRRAVDYAIQENLPLVSLSCSTGARLYEGASALLQTVKTVEAILRLKGRGLPYFSLLANPCTGAVVCSYAALGDITIAEPGALVSLTGPRVMKAHGLTAPEEALRARTLHPLSPAIYDRLDFYRDIRGIQEVRHRRDMKNALARYLDFYSRISGPPGKRGGRKRHGG
ncbi:MAG: acetyl-CoA carboxylase carboxyl transferase subunit alpha/beta [Deltaproteobacteria bacterium]|nr:acetyl-CoA carboxylase carboxyl transferase subunit alpha/beta [Deltaproteobacteria bacterium]